MTLNTANINDSSTTIIINGAGFSTTALNNSVAFNLGVVGSVTHATATQLTVTVSTPPTTLGGLSATVTTGGTSSSAVQVGTVVWDSVVTRLTPDSATAVGTLRYALANIQAGVPITFESSLSGGTILLTSVLTISQNVTITGLGAANLAVSGNNAVEVLLVNSGVTANISSLTVENGHVAGSGGGIANKGNLTLSYDTITGNTAVTGTTGGGIFNESGGTLTLSNSIVSNNSCEYAAGIGNQGVLIVTNSTVSQNIAAMSGAGIYNYGGTVTLSNSTIANNHASGGSNGGGLVNMNFNSAVGHMMLTDDTIYGNSGHGSGGGVDNASGTLTLTNVTITGNTGQQGGGIATVNGQSTTISNSIVAGNTATLGADQYPDYIGSMVTNYDLIGNTYGQTVTGSGNVLNPSYVGLGSVGSYGGLTQTFALLPGSPAIDAGSNSLDGGVATDQRGDTRVVNGTVDIGAFESQGFTFAIVSGNNQSANLSSAFSPLAVSVTANNSLEPVNGGHVTFAVTPAADGAGATLATSPVTISGGQASVTPTANALAGAYTVSASASGASAVSFNLKNLPTVTASSADLSANAATLTIAGAGFDMTAGNDSVTFSNGVIGSVTAATSSSLTVSLTGLSSVTGGTALTASVTVDGASGSAVQVATVAPVITASSAGLQVNATSLTIAGFGFDTAANDSVVFDNGVTGSITSATSTSLTVSLSGLASVAPGTALHATVTVDGAGSGSPVEVAVVTKAITTTSLTDNGPNPSVSGQPVGYTVTTTVVPDGATVYLYDADSGDAEVGSVTIESGSGSTSIADLSAGAHAIYAVYGGDATHTTSQSAQQTQTVEASEIAFNGNNYSSAQLQEAINLAEASGLADPTITITGWCVGGVTIGAFTHGTTGTLTLTASFDGTVIAPTGGDASTSDNALIEVTGGASVELKGLDITGASANPNLTYGVDVSGSGTSVNINNSTIQDIGNTGTQTGSVYGVYVTGAAELTMSSSSVTSIADQTGSFGGIGALVTGGSSATLMSDTITGYQADGIVVSGASSSAAITSSTVTGIGNDADDETGILIGSGATGEINSTSITENSLAGIYVSGANSVTVSNDVIETNYQGLYVGAATVTAVNDTISDNSGGGIDNAASGTLTLSNSTVSGNSAASGGGIDNSGTATLSNDTISGNTASVSGGGIDNAGVLTLSNNTNSGNTGGNYAPGSQPTDVAPAVTLNGVPEASLQAAINNASGANPVITITGPVVGGVMVPSGGFTGTLTITGGAGGTITAPTDGSTSTPDNALIEVTSGVSVAISNLDITGASANPTLTYGVYVYGSSTSVSISNSTIQNIGNASQTAASIDGVYVAGSAQLTMTDSTVTNIEESTGAFGGIGVQIGDSTLSGAAQLGFGTLQNDTINNYQADGIFINGANGSTPSFATISNCTVTGVGPTPYGYGATGIEIYLGAGTIEDSNITGNHDTSSSYQGTGIFVYSGSSTTNTNVLNSVVSDNDVDMENYAGPTTIICSGDTFNGGDDPEYTNSDYLIGFGICDPGGGGTGYVNLLVSNSYFSGCQVGAYSQGNPMTITGTTVCNNVPLPSNAPFSDAGIWNQGGGGSYGVVLSNDLIFGNTAANGGGGYTSTYGGYTTITDTEITNNVSQNNGGGGVYDSANGFVTVSNSIIAYNSAPVGGGIDNTGSAMLVTLNNSTVSGNTATTSGGGIDNVGSLAVTNSTVSGNTTGGNGGGIYNGAGGTASLTRSTLAGNSAQASSGGGIYNVGSLSLSNATIAYNYSGKSGGGILNATAGTLTLVDTIVAANTDDNAGPDDVYNNGSITASYSLIGNSTNSGVSGGSGNILNPGSLGLSALDNYGGPTETIALLPGSAAIGAGETVVGITTDQRGFSLPGTSPDIGAFELQTITPSIASLPVTSISLTINGFAFDPTAANDSVTFSNGVIGTVTGATSTSLTVSLTGVGSLTGGTVLTASVTVDGVSSGSAVQVATVAPVVTASTAVLLGSADSLTIAGFGFDAVADNDSVTFDNGVTGTVMGASGTSLTVSVTGLGALAAGTALDAIVTVDGASSGSAVQVATVIPPTYAESLDGSGKLVISQEITGANDNLSFSLSGGFYTLTDSGGLLFDTPTGVGASDISGSGTDSIAIPCADISSITIELGTGTNSFTLAGTNGACAAPITVNTGAAGADQLDITGSVADSGDISLTAGAISETGSGALSTTATLTTSSVAGTNLGGANAVGTFNAADSSAGGISLTNSYGPLTITGIGETGGGDITVNNTGDVNITGTVSAAGGNINLTSSTALTESGSGLIDTTGTLTTSSGNGATLNGANVIGTFNATDDSSAGISLTNSAGPLTITGIGETGGGDITVNNTGDVDITGTVSAAGGDISLTSTTALSETGDGLISTTGTLTVSSGNGTSLGGANTIGTFNATDDSSAGISLTNSADPLTITTIGETGDGDITVNNTGDVNITGTVSAAGGDISLTSSTALSETGDGLISTTGTLTVSSGNGATLGGANTIGAFNATDDSSAGISLTNSADPLTITGIDEADGGDITVNNTGDVNITGMVSAAGGNISLTSSTALSETGDGLISTTGTLTVSSGNGASLGGANTVGTFSATDDSSAGISLTNSVAPLTITGIGETGGGDVTVNNTGDMDITGTVSAVGGDISLTSSTALSETGDGLIDTTGTLTVSSGNGASLGGANTIGTFSATDDSSAGISLTNSADPLTITGIGETDGGDITVNNTGDVNITGTVSAAGGDIFLTSSTALSETGDGLISTAGTLTVSSGNGASLDGANSVGTFNATDDSSAGISLTNSAGPLTITGIDETGGGDITVNNTGDVSITGTVSASGDISLTSSTALSETGDGLIGTTGTLTVSSGNGTFLGGANTIGAFNATDDSSAGISLTNSAAPLTITGIGETGGGDITVNNRGDVNITGTVSAVGAIYLTSSTALAESGSGLIDTAGTLTTSSGAGTNLGGVNTVGTFSATDDSSAGVSLTDTVALIVSGIGETSDGGVTLESTGDITIAGAVATSGGGVALTADSDADGAGTLTISGGSGSIAAGSGPVTITAAGVDLEGAITSSGTVSIAPSVSGTAISLGGSTPGSFSITAAELDEITAGTLAIGSAGSGAITVSADVTLAAPTAVNLISGAAIAISGGTFDTDGGSMSLTPGSAGVNVTEPGTDVSVGTDLTFASGSNLNIAINGATVDTDYDQLNVAGTVNLCGVHLVLSGTFSSTSSNVFTIVSATAVAGTFCGLPEGSIIEFNGDLLQVGYTATAVTLTDVVIAVGDDHAGLAWSGATVTFTATITESAGITPTGSVEFYDNGEDLGPGSSLSGSGNTATSTFATSAMPAGTNSITVVFTPTGNANSSTSLADVVLVDNITLSPADQITNVGLGATFSAASSNPAGTDAVQWEVSTDDGVTFNEISDEISATLSLASTSASQDGYEYEAVFTNSSGSATTAPATLFVDHFSSPPSGQMVDQGQSATFTAQTTDPSGTDTIQWQVSTDGGNTFTGIAGVTSGTLTVSSTTASQNGDEYEAIFTNSLGSVTSSAATLTVDYAPTVTASPGNVTVTAGQDATFTAAAAANPSAAIAWEVSTDDGGSFNPVPGASSATLTVAATVATQNGAEYEVVFTNALGTATSTIATLTVDYVPTVSASPTDQTVTAGLDATFTATADGNPSAAIAWEVSTDGGSMFSVVPGASAATLTVAGTLASQDGDEYEAIFTNSVGSATSDVATLTVDFAPTVNVAPSDTTVLAGQAATFTAAAAADPSAAIQWQVSSDDGVSFTAVSGATGATLTVTGTSESDNGYEYEAVFSNPVGSATSAAATLTVDYLATVTLGPVNQTVTAGQTASFTAQAVNATGVQWQVSSDSGESFNDVSGATNATLTLLDTVAGQNGYEYEAIFSNAVSSATSSPAELTVDYAPTVTLGPVNQTVTAGLTATFTAGDPANPSAGVQWQVSSDEGVSFANVSGATCTTLTVAALASEDGYEYEAVFTNSVGSATSAAATLTVDYAPTVNVDPVNQTVTAGQTATFTAAAAADPSATVQWEVSTGGGSFSNVSGGMGATLTLAGTLAGQNGDEYEAVFTNPMGTATSGPATLTVDFVPTVTVSPSNPTVTAGQGATFSAAALANPCATSVQWQVSTNGGGTFTSISGATSATLTVAGTVATQNGDEYEAVFTNAVGTGTSSPATLTVDYAPTVTGNPSNQTTAAGQTATFTAAADANPAASVDWLVSTDDGGTFTSISGATAATLTLPSVLAGENSNEYEAIFSNSVGTTTTGPATLTVDFVPTVTMSPINQTVTAGQGVTFSAAAVANPSVTAVQWQVSTNGGGSFASLSGATNATLTVNGTIATQNGDEYEAVFGNSVGSATSSPATLTVDFAPTVTLSPTNQTVTAGHTATFTAAANANPSASVAWEVSTDDGGSFTSISGVSSATLTIAGTLATQDGDEFEAIFTNPVGTATSSAATLTVDYTPTVTVNPGNQTVTAGQAATFSAAAVADPTAGVQWKVSSNGGGSFTNVSGGTGATLTVPATVATQNGNDYEAVFTNAVGSATSNAATLTVDYAPTVTLSPSNQTVTAGQSATFSAAANANPSATIAWLVSTDDGVSFTSVGGASGATLTVPATVAAENGNEYEAVFTNSVGAATSSAAVLTVDFAPTVSASPSNQTVTTGQAATFTAAAVANPSATVRWQVSTNGGGNFTGVSGASSATLTVPATLATENGNEYEAIFTNSVGAATSSAAVLTVDYSPTVNLNPSSATVTAGQTASFTAAALANPSAAVQWQVSTGGSYSAISGATSATLTVAGTVAAENGSRYEAVFTNSVSTATSAAATLTVDYAPTVSVAPVNLTVTPGQAATFSAAALANPSAAVQWQISTNGGASFTAVSGATNGTLAIAALVPENGYEYEAVFANAVGSATSSAATLTVDYAPTVMLAPSSQTAATGQAATFTAQASANPAATVQWQISTNGGGAFSNVSGATIPTLTVPSTAASENGYEYKAIFTNSFGSVTTAAALLTVDYAPTVSGNPTNQTVTAGQSATFSAAAAVANPSAAVQWQVSTNGGSFTNISGGTLATLTVPAATASENGYEYEAIFTNPVGSATSSPATLTVDYAPTVSLSPANVTVTAGQPATFTAAANADPSASVQWLVNTNGTSFTSISGATSATLSVAATAAQNGYEYEAVFANQVGNVTSSAAVLTVDFAPSIAVAPANQTVDVGDNAVFTATGSANPSASVQWKLSTDGGNTFTAVSGATGATLTVPAVTATESGYEYEAVFTNAVAAVTSTPAALTVDYPPALGVLSTSAWTVNEPSFDGTIAIASGTAPFSHLTVQGLPSGLSYALSGSTISFTGTPKTVGTFSAVSVSVTDVTGAVISGAYSITVNAAPTLGTLSQTAWTENQSGYGGTIQINYGTPSFGNLSVNGLPAGLGYALNGSTISITGTSTASGTFNNIAVIVSDAAGATASHSYSLTINAPPTLGTLSKTAWTVNQPSYAGSIPIIGGTAPFGNLSVSGLPSGLSYALAGSTISITGSPTVSGTFSGISVNLTDGAGVAAGNTYTMTVYAPAAIGSLSPSQWTVSSANPAAYNGTIPITSAAPIASVSVTGLPSGLSYALSGNTVKISGKPTVAGTYGSIHVTAVSSTGASTTSYCSLLVNAAPSFGALSSTTWTQNLANYAGTITIKNGTAPYQITTVSGLPSDMSYSLSGSVISFTGVPQSSGSFNVQVTAEDAASAVFKNTFALTIYPQPTLGALSQTIWTVGQAYHATIAVGSNSSPLSTSVTGLPVGIIYTVSGNTITLSGTPQATGVFSSIHVSVANSAGGAASSNYTLTIVASPTLGALSAPQWTVSTPSQAAYDGTIAIGNNPVAGGAATVTGLPAGLTYSLSNNAITITGKPIATGTFSNIKLTFTNSAGADISASYALTVNPLPTLGAMSQTTGQVDQANFTSTIAISGGTPKFGGLSVTGLPSGLTYSLSGNVITISGQPTSAGTFSVKVSVLDAASTSATRTYTLTITPAATLGALSATTAAENQTYTGSIAITNSTAPISAVTIAGLPAGLTYSLTGTTILITGEPTQTGTFGNITVTITNDDGAAVTKSYSLTVLAHV